MKYAKVAIFLTRVLIAGVLIVEREPLDRTWKVPPKRAMQRKYKGESRTRFNQKVPYEQR
jgi:hypothetical protein